MRSAAVLVAVVLVSCGRTVVYEPPVFVAEVDAGVDGGVKPCMTGAVPLSHTTPAIFFVIDRSGSMASDLKGNTGPPFGNPLEGPTRWQILSDTMSEVLPKHDTDLAMGAVIFPTNNLCGFVPHVDVQPKTGTSGDILRLFANPPGGGTPISAAVDSMRGPAMTAKAKSIVLITDGEPNCNDALDPTTCPCTQPLNMDNECASAQICLDDARSVGTVGRLFSDGVVTHVVGFATTAQAGVTLDQLAIAGGAPRMGSPKFYSAETQAELSDVLTGISARETNCTWTALTVLKADDALEVRVGGELVPEGTGWEWLQREQGSFVLRGTWCEKAFAGASVTAVLTCRN